MKQMNAYNFTESSCVFYHAIARDEQHAIELAREAGFNIDDMEVELEKTNVRDELGRPLKAKIEDALIY